LYQRRKGLADPPATSLHPQLSREEALLQSIEDFLSVEAFKNGFAKTRWAAIARTHGAAKQRKAFPNPCLEGECPSRTGAEMASQRPLGAFCAPISLAANRRKRCRYKEFPKRHAESNKVMPGFTKRARYDLVHALAQLLTTGLSFCRLEGTRRGRYL
jgi:hypothetical protein